jgi:hypothetical protein
VFDFELSVCAKIAVTPKKVNAVRIAFNFSAFIYYGFLVKTMMFLK